MLNALSRLELISPTWIPISGLIVGGGAPEIHVSRLLSQHAQTLKGMEAYCFQAFADALEVIPTTLAENAGLPNPVAVITELRSRHAAGERTAGINVRKVIGSRWICHGNEMLITFHHAGLDQQYVGRERSSTAARLNYCHNIGNRNCGLIIANR